MSEIAPTSRLSPPLFAFAIERNDLAGLHHGWRTILVCRYGATALDRPDDGPRKRAPCKRDSQASEPQVDAANDDAGKQNACHPEATTFRIRLRDGVILLCQPCGPLRAASRFATVRAQVVLGWRGSSYFFSFSKADLGHHSATRLRASPKLHCHHLADGRQRVGLGRTRTNTSARKLDFEGAGHHHRNISDP